MTLAFTTAVVVLTSGFAPTSRFRKGRAWSWRVPPHKRAAALHQVVACAPAEKPATDAEEESHLDEAAMRAAEIHEVLTGLKDFKNRIIDDATKLAKKVRAPKKQLEAALAAHPDIIKIDGHIAELEEELKVLGDR